MLARNVDSILLCCADLPVLIQPRSRLRRNRKSND